VSHLVTGGATNAATSLVPGLDVLSSLAANGQLFQISKDIHALQTTLGSVLNIASAGAALSGLGFVTSIAGFAYMSKRLSAIDSQLTKILDEIKDLKSTLMYQQYSLLRAAIDLMKHAELAGDDNLRLSKLSQANERFMELRYFYADQWRESKEIKQLPFLEDCYVLAFTGAAMTNSSLGLHDVASYEFSEHRELWQKTARAHIKKHLLNEDPRRLFNGISSQTLPTRELVEMLDFANESDKGLGWIDELRKVPKSIDVQFKTPKQNIVKMASALTARDGGLSAAGEHLRYLAAKRMSANDFALLAEDERKKLDAPAVCITATPQSRE